MRSTSQAVCWGTKRTTVLAGRVGRWKYVLPEDGKDGVGRCAEGVLEKVRALDCDIEIGECRKAASGNAGVIAVGVGSERRAVL